MRINRKKYIALEFYHALPNSLVILDKYFPSCTNPTTFWNYIHQIKYAFFNLFIFRLVSIAYIANAISSQRTKYCTRYYPYGSEYNIACRPFYVFKFELLS